MKDEKDMTTFHRIVYTQMAAAAAAAIGICCALWSLEVLEVNI